MDRWVGARVWVGEWMDGWRPKEIPQEREMPVL